MPKSQMTPAQLAKYRANLRAKKGGELKSDKKKITPFRTLNEAFNRRVRVWVCKSCDTWCQETKPEFCTSCGHDEFYYFASKTEAKRYAELLLLERTGQIQNLQTQMNYPLYVNDQLIATYRADFVYEENGSTIVEDVKANSKGDKALTSLFEIKRKLVKALYDIDIRITRR